MTQDQTSHLASFGGVNEERAIETFVRHASLKDRSAEQTQHIENLHELLGQLDRATRSLPALDVNIVSETTNSDYATGVAAGLHAAQQVFRSLLAETLVALRQDELRAVENFYTDTDEQ